MPTVSSYSFLSVYSCVVSSSPSIANLHLPVGSIPFLQNGMFLLLSLPSSLQLDHIANLEDRKSLLPRNHFPLDIVGIKAIITQALKQGQQSFSMPTVSSSSSYNGPSQPIWVVSSYMLLLFLR